MSRHEAIVGKLLAMRRPYRRLILSPGDPGPLAVTKLSGVPWWPRGIARPECHHGHGMAFIAQFRIDETPGFDQPPSLLSFHYCDECAYAGEMAWGWKDRGRRPGYDVRIFLELDAPADDHGIAAPSRVEPNSVDYEDGVESPGLEDTWEAFPETAVPGGAPEDPRLVNFDRAKLGGWPSWVHFSERPEDDSGEMMAFVAQLDMWTCPETTWCTGAAFLFASAIDDGEQQAELVIQTT